VGKRFDGGESKLIDIDTKKKALNIQQTKLREILMSHKHHDKALELFMAQHAAMHSAEVSGGAAWSYPDALLKDLTYAQLREIPRKKEHSIAWVLWHIARIEDVTMNMLVAGEDQLLKRDGWSEKLGIEAGDTGNGMDAAMIAAVSEKIDVEALRAYRNAVGRRTRDIVRSLTVEDLKVKTDPARLTWVMGEEAVLEEGRGVVEYWGKRKIEGLLLMPPTRHLLVHLNEIYELRKRLV
jgi:hypothetical protein